MKQVYLFCLILILTVLGNQKNFSQDSNSFLPTPSGPYQIGVQDIFVIDSSRKDPFKKSQDRKLYIKVWYPAMIADSAKPEKYLGNYSDDLIFDVFKSKKLKKEWLSSLKEMDTHSYPLAPIIENDAILPVIIFNPGFYFGFSELYSGFMEELASHGYLVFSINHPYEQPYIKFPPDEEIYIKKKRAQWAYLQLVFADWFQWRKKDSPENIEKITRYYHRHLRRFNKEQKLWVTDSKFFIDYLVHEKKNSDQSIFKKMDLNSMAAFGQSFGGAVSGQLCLESEYIKAVINMDCFQFGDMIDQPLEDPVLLMESNYNPDWNLGNTINFKETKADFAYLFFPQASHFIYSDGAVLPYETEDYKRSMIGDIDGQRAFLKMRSYMLHFFNHYLKDQKSELLLHDISNNHLEYYFKPAK